jgi:Leucine-rich repeat (LRR) protein
MGNAKSSSSSTASGSSSSKTGTGRRPSSLLRVNKNDVQDVLSGLPGSKPRVKRGGKVVRSKIATAEKTSVLSLSEHGLSRIPREVLELTRLRSLVLSGNNLASLPDLTLMKSLRTLRLDDNKLSSLPSMAGLDSLTELSCSGNQIGPGGDCVSDLPASIKTLILGRNLLAQFPTSTRNGGLPSLQTLNLEKNAITDIPELNLPELLELNLDSNRVTHVGAVIVAMKKLRTLSMRHNKIGPASLASELFLETPVSVLNLEGNPLTKKDLLDCDGIQSFLDRRKELKDRNLMGGAFVSLSVCGIES